eukprot:gnl/TRDRNA2_/TRDRNA2_56516_c0_seq1.p1 gnl/TRDRNA2_/TRDRNA2_56516_c0~~gnl/TRDRNA2_/TRDRNA2_56516_c0_seq1.p1  ORF type:complete len:232 (+),score=20.90 gnl/TRDRNA2_/TRDRNA2_56516_c0_seq1:105-800(+)
MALAVDCGVLVSGLATPIAVMYGMFAVSGLPTKVWFGWHPVLMSVAFSCLMFYGRWAYVGELWGPSKAVRRVIHLATMVLASVAMIMGYVAIFKAHWPKGQFFGYNFQQGKWETDITRIAHGWIGYGIICLVVAQAAMGSLKLNRLQATGERTLTFHGSLGKMIMLAAGLNILLAVWFWGWTTSLKSVVAIPVLATTAVFVLWPQPAKVEDTPDYGLADSDSNSLMPIAGA